MALPPSPNCPRCGVLLPPTALICPNCGMFVHAQLLADLSNEALQLESTSPIVAAAKWREILDLIPPDSPQYQNISYRMAKLAAGIRPADPPPGQSPVQRPPPRDDSLSVALLKTFGSMLLSIVVYAYLFGDWVFSVIFVVLILVHEMGHVVANRYYGLKASPPIFIPFVGAVINLRQRPANAKVEAVVGIGGPIAGTLGAFVTYLIYLHTHSQVALVSANFGFLINLFNLLPVPPLDGGRVTAAVSPWIWLLGLAGLGWLFYVDLRQGHVSWILILVVVYAFPRIKATLQGRDRFADYYKISKLASYTIATVYVLLGVVLLFMYQATQPQ